MVWDTPIVVEQSPVINARDGNRGVNAEIFGQNASPPVGSQCKGWPEGKYHDRCPRKSVCLERFRTMT